MVPNSLETSTLYNNKEVKEDIEDVGLISELYLLNRDTKDTFYYLVAWYYKVFY